MHAIKVDQPPREGVVTSVSGALLHIKWSTGEETTMIPGPGSLAVIGKVREASAKKAPAKVTKSARKTTKKSTR
jgi:hypothetical protein